MTQPCSRLVGARAPEGVDPDASRARRRHALRRTRSPSVTTLVLDVGGVVIPTLFESAAAQGLPSGPFPGDGGRPDPEYSLVENGQLAERDYWARLAQRRPDLDIGALWRGCSVVRADVTALIERIDGRVRLVAFTNDMAHWFGSDWEHTFPIMRWFDTVLEAAVLGVFKPDPHAFRVAASALGEEPSRCLFVDDLAANLAGAASVGMHTELFDVRAPAASMNRVASSLGLPPPDAPRRVFSAPRIGR
ncbi:HAD-IA family hydrolase [Pseudonocardia spinosispora]|uniref:HAD-IA family hydrolase n=1 Tax=Pseudonocardia spinosispora TaxID=103441 RepID=UPI00041EBF6A|nr:HAD-IA family hydrolase [Pseudonocardia spinosispora]